MFSYQHLRYPTETDLAKIEQIYEDNFPEEEKIPYDWLKQQMITHEIETMVARHESGEIAGMLWAEQLGDSPYYFIPYFAVDEAFQGHGIGGNLIKAMVKHLANFEHIHTLIWEVEAPTDDPKHQTNRRVAFYNRNGAEIVKYSEGFAMPDFTDEKGVRGVPMRLMFINIGKHNLPNDKAQGIAWLQAMYTFVYEGYPHLRDHAFKVANEMA
jgi:ribosomal protein S18 acetylase RimI-like enzyme